MRTIDLISLLALALGAVGCGDDEKDSFEESYARAVCERDFKCYPDIARNYNNDIGMCVGNRMGELTQRRVMFGDACVDATLDAWACKSQASCYAERDGQACATPFGAFQKNCSGLTVP